MNSCVSPRRVDIARLEQARGDDAAAKAALTEAIETFRAYGAREYQELTGSPL